MSKKVLYILLGLVVGLATGGVAYAVIINPPSSAERYYACVTNTGVVRYGTLRLDAPPTSCPATSDEIHSWNAKGEVGPTGSAGPTGATGAQGPAAPGPKIRHIYFDEQNFTVSPIADGGYGDILTPVDTSECAEIALEAITSFSGPVEYVSNPLYPEIVKVDPESGDWIGAPTARTAWGPKGGVAYPATTVSNVPYPVGLGREFGVSTSVRFSNGTPGTFTVKSVWIRCYPFG